jgi:hypothetical protein
VLHAQQYEKAVHAQGEAANLVSFPLSLGMWSPLILLIIISQYSIYMTLSYIVFKIKAKFINRNYENCVKYNQNSITKWKAVLCQYL